MPRKRVRKRRRYYDDYEDERGGCWSRLTRFLYGLMVAILVLLGGLLVIWLVLLAYTYQAYLRVALIVALVIGVILLLALVVKLFIEIIKAIVKGIASMRLHAITASKANVDLSRRKLERDAYRQQLYSKQLQDRPLRPVQVETRPPLPSLSQHLSVTPSQPEKLVRLLPKLTVPLASSQHEIPGMPPQHIVYYHTMQHLVRPGQLVAVIRTDGTPRIEAWSTFKSLLVLGGSSSGKTTTIVEKVLGFVSGGGLIAPCDPHTSKTDSLFHRIHPLVPALYPGATFAVEHGAILQNIRLVKNILEARIRGADSSQPVMLVVEELNRLLRDKAIAREISTILEALGEEGRGFNVFVIVGCQKVTGLADIRKAFISYIVHRCDETEAQLIIPQRYAKYCPELRTGQCFVKDSEGMTEAGLQVFVTEQDIETAAMRLVYHRPTRPLVQKLPTRPSVPSTTSTPPSTPRRLILRPLPQDTEGQQPRPNPLHTWSAPTHEGIEHTFPNPLMLPDTQQPVSSIDTEEVDPSPSISVEQQLELLARLRKKKSQPERDN